MYCRFVFLEECLLAGLNRVSDSFLLYCSCEYSLHDAVIKCGYNASNVFIPSFSDMFDL